MRCPKCDTDTNLHSHAQVCDILAPGRTHFEGWVFAFVWVLAFVCVICTLIGLGETLGF
jgi:hypothetical protein